jgi:transcription elongation factor Elf1
MITEHWLEDVAICPHCGGEHFDSWEFFKDLDDQEQEVQVECHHCEKEFTTKQEISVTYSSWV